MLIEVKIDASALVLDADEVKAAIEKAVKQTIPCQLYSLEVNEKKETLENY